jgi:Leucine-rich repeat (LRR) protein
LKAAAIFFIFLAGLNVSGQKKTTRQSFTIAGKVVDRKSKEELPFVVINFCKKDKSSKTSTTDFDGQFLIRFIEAGTLSIKLSAIGYRPVEIQNFSLRNDTLLFFQMETGNIKSDSVEIYKNYTAPLIPLLPNSKINPLKQANPAKDISLKGRLTDKKTKQPVSNGVLTLLPGGKQAQTDAQGNYAFRKIPAGVYSLKYEANYGDFKDSVITGIKITGDSVLVLNLELNLIRFVPELPGINGPYLDGPELDPRLPNEEAVHPNKSVSHYWGYYWKQGKKHLKKAQLRSLEELVDKAEEIKQLELMFYDGAQLPSEIAYFKNLEQLELSFYDSTLLPPELWELKNLKELILRNPDTIPAEIKNLSNLVHLEIQGANINHLPPEIGSLKNLKTFIFYSNSLTNLPAEIGNLSQLENLSLRLYNMTQVLPEIGKLIRLRSLKIEGSDWLSKNKLLSLPKEIGQLTALTYLSLRGNELRTLPPEIGNLVNLEEIDLQNCSLDALPGEMAKLANLKILNLKRNNLQTLPDEFGHLKKLYRLNAEENKLASLPPQFGELSALAHLSLEENKLTGLPPGFGNLASLAALNLKNNPLKNLPADFTNLKNLSWLQIEKKDLLSVNKEVWTFINSWGYKIPKVPATINGQPVSFFLTRKDIDPYSKKYIQGKMALSNEAATEIIFDSLLTNNPVTAPFYLYLITSCMVKDCTYLFDINPDTSVAFDLARPCARYIRKNPCRFFEQIKYGPYKHYFKPWCHAARGLINEENETDEEMEIELRKKLKAKCGARFKGDMDKLIYEFTWSEK